MLCLKKKNAILDIVITLGISLLFTSLFIPLFLALGTGFLLLITPDWVPYSCFTIVSIIPEVVSFALSGFMIATFVGFIFKNARKTIILPATIVVAVATLIITYKATSEVIEGIEKSISFLWIETILELIFLWIGTYLGILLVNRTINVKQNSKHSM